MLPACSIALSRIKSTLVSFFKFFVELRGHDDRFRCRERYAQICASVCMCVFVRFFSTSNLPIIYFFLINRRRDSAGLLMIDKTAIKCFVFFLLFGNFWTICSINRLVYKRILVLTFFSYVCQYFIFDLGQVMVKRS